MQLSAASAFLLLAAILGGCTTSVRMPNAEEAAAIHSGQKAIVMMRIEARFDNDPVAPFSIDSENFFIMKAASYEGDRKVRDLWPYRSPSEEALKEGWIYFLLEPGSHYLYVKAPPFSRDLDRIRSYSTYWIMVPRGKQLIYAGTLIAACKSRKLFFSKKVEDCSGLRLADESSRAAAGASAYFGGFGPAAVSVAEKYPLSVQGHKNILPEVVINGLPALGTPDWQKRGIAKTTGIGGDSDGDNETRGIGLGGGGDPRGYAGLVMLYILYLPIGITAGAVTGSLNEGRWSECIKDFDAGIHTMDMERLIRNELESKSSDRAESSADGTGGRLDITIQRITIRECSKSSTFCPEIAIRATYREKRNGEPVFDTVYAYSDSHIEYETPAYKMRQAGGESCRELGDYCAAKGKPLFYEEIQKGISWIMARVRHDLGLGPR